MRKIEINIYPGKDRYDIEKHLSEVGNYIFRLDVQHQTRKRKDQRAKELGEQILACFFVKKRDWLYELVE
jgi:hypothetical protein